MGGGTNKYYGGISVSYYWFYNFPNPFIWFSVWICIACVCITNKKGLVVLNITDRPFSFMSAPGLTALGGGLTLGIFLRSKLLLDWPYLEVFGLFQWEKIIFCQNAYFCLKYLYSILFGILFWKVWKIPYFFLRLS